MRNVTKMNNYVIPCLTFLLMTALTAREVEDMSAFLKAIELGDVTLAQETFRKGATNKKLKSAWLLKGTNAAIGTCNIKMLIALKAEGANLTGLGANRLAPIHLASMKCDENFLEALQKLGIGIRNKTSDNETGLHTAALAGNLSAINFFLRQGFDIDIPSDGGWKPIYWAAHTCSTTAIDLLITKGAKFDKDEILMRAGFHHPDVYPADPAACVAYVLKLNPSKKAIQRLACEKDIVGKPSRRSELLKDAGYSCKN